MQRIELKPVSGYLAYPYSKQPVPRFKASGPPPVPVDTPRQGFTLRQGLWIALTAVVSAVVGFQTAWTVKPDKATTPAAHVATTDTPPTQKPPQLGYYPPSKPFNKFMLPVSKTHTIYVEESGNPDGFPVFYLHGGPAAGLSTEYQDFFDPQFFHIIGFEQRGCGRSTPLGGLRENTTWDLVEDIQRIRTKLGIKDKKYLLWGGSWGSLLAIAAAEKNPEDVAGLIVRGISLGRPKDTAWSTRPGDGMFHMYPETGEYFGNILKLAEQDPRDVELQRDPMLGVYDRLLNDPDVPEAKRREVLKLWRLGNTYTSGERLDKKALVEPDPDYEEHLASARIVCRYYYRNAFMNPPDQLIRDAYKLRNIPFIFIINGRDDINTPAKRAHDFHKALLSAGATHAQLHIVEDAGHSAGNPNTLPKLLQALKDFQTMNTPQK